MALEVFDTIKQVYSNGPKYNNWVKDQKNREISRSEYAKANPLTAEQSKMSDSYGRTIVEAINTMDEYSETKAEHVEEVLNQVGGFVPYAGAGVGLIPLGLYKLISKNPNPAIVKKLASLSIGGFVLATVGYVIAASTLQKSASRIARFQARETELKDPQNFVVFTPDQIKEAEDMAKMDLNSSNQKDKSPLNPLNQIKEISQSVKSLLKDKKAYKEWLHKAKLQEAERMKSFGMNPSDEQLKKAQNYQDVLFRTISKIDIASQDYSENIETLSESVMMAGPVIGAAAGGLLSGAVWLLQKAKVISNASGVLNAVKKFAAPASAIALPLFAGMYFVQMQVEAARVGRHKAKNELMKDPYNFIPLSDQDLGTVKNADHPQEPKKGFFNSLMDNMSELSQIRKDFKEYKKYKKEHKAQDDKFKKALNKLQVTDQQLTEAKSLQDKTFRIFEKMDEMSQRYAEDIEAGTGLAILAALPVLMGTSFKVGFSVMNKFPKAAIPAMVLMNVANLAGILGLSVVATKVQKRASKIGLMKAMEDLKDPRHFVDFTGSKMNSSQPLNGIEENANNSSTIEVNPDSTIKPELPPFLTPEYPQLTPSPVLPGSTTTNTLSLQNKSFDDINIWINSLHSK